MPDYPIPYHSTWDIKDSSKLRGDFQTCERAYFYRDLLGWKGTAPNNDLVFGEAAHKAKEHLWLNGYGNTSIQDAFVKFQNIYRPKFPQDTDELYGGKTPDGWLSAMVKYTDTYASDFDKYEVLYTEIAGTVPIDKDRVLHFRMDTVLEERDSGRKVSMDLKTKGSSFGGKVGMVWENDHYLSIQNGTYTHCLYCLYPQEEVKGMIFDGVGVWRNKGGYMCDLFRPDAYLSPRQMQVWLWSVVDILDRIDYEMERLASSSEGDEVLMAFPMRTENCTKYFRVCPYHDFCLTYSNPLQMAFEVPIGFEVDFWDPRSREETANKVVNLEGLKGGEEEDE